jgi:hypothetical protein
MQGNFLITLDIDWAPDIAIDFVADQLIRQQVRATWFVTHHSPAVERLRTYPELFELGIHPNFLPGSTHGTTPEEVLETCMGLIPDAKSMRTHALFQSTPLLMTVMRKTKIIADASLFLPYTDFIRPCEYYCDGKTLLRFPFFWEDDFEMLHSPPLWNCLQEYASPGLKIFNFHPIHIYLNSCNYQAYNLLKARCFHLQDSGESTMSDLINQKRDGTGTTFSHLVHFLSNKKSSRIIDLITGEFA